MKQNKNVESFKFLWIEDVKTVGGICYMLSTGIGIEGTENYVYTSEEYYCPDYYNRKKEKIKFVIIKIKINSHASVTMQFTNRRTRSS